MRYLAALLAVLTSPAWAIDPSKLGDQYDTYTVPHVQACDPPATCLGLWFTLRHERPYCVRYEDIWVRRPDGSPVPFEVTETGNSGEQGYQLDVVTPPEISGLMTLHVRVVDGCWKIS